MIKFIFSVFLCLISLTNEAQVYLSKIYNDILVLGPNNVAPHCNEIANSYVSDLEGFYDLLIKEQTELKEAIANIEKVVAPTKAQLFTQNEKQGDIDLIENELTIIMQFKELWLKIIDQTPVKFQLVDLIRDGQCVEINTNHGNFSTNEYMVTLDKDIRKIKIIEHIAIEQRDSIPQWITKISDNCASQDPEDCMMWCFINQEGGDVLVDFTGDLYKLEDSKIASQFNMVPNAKHASRELSMDLEGISIDIINIVKSDNNMLLQLDGFSTIECKE